MGRQPSVGLHQRHRSLRRPEIVGYTIEEYSADAADVSIVQRFPDDSLASTLTPVTWSGDDWKLTLPVSDTNPVEDLATLPDDIVDLEGTRQ
ncbi:hypothetical protein A3Q41_04911 (plasmid) [Rhodococcoides fascians]|uniref:DUF8175 domain-containing protein n=1 Tax=Rhodococcoides fascians TaxID=1828 RepID=A0A143QTL3_RHOFA|nr:hypothetical protein A3Q41_04911 [Rhodococcus fascians]